MELSAPTDATAPREVLAVLLARPRMSAGELDEAIETLVRYAGQRGIPLSHYVAAYEQGRVITTCLCVDSPGRVSSIFLPSLNRYLACTDALVNCLQEAIRRAGSRAVQLLQGTTTVDAELESRVFGQAGFERLVELISMDRDVSEPLGPPTPAPELDYVTYDTGTHPLFCEVLKGTYEDSLDCVRLNGVRAIEDILASHRAAGEFEPTHWWISRVGDTPAGTILLSRVPERWAWEVVYMGVLPAWRGQGVGKAMLRRAIQSARDQAVGLLSLSVDAQNGPACRLYQRMGFRNVSRRTVWSKNLEAP